MCLRHPTTSTAIFPPPGNQYSRYHHPLTNSSTYSHYYYNTWMSESDDAFDMLSHQGHSLGGSSIHREVDVSKKLTATIAAFTDPILNLIQSLLMVTHSLTHSLTHSHTHSLTHSGRHGVQADYCCPLLERDLHRYPFHRSAGRDGGAADDCL